MVDSTNPDPGASPGAASSAATSGSNPASETPVQGGASPANIVQVSNRTDGRLRVEGRVQFNEIRGSVVTPVNIASAYSSCVNCQTLAVALQLNIFPRSATTIAPTNVAAAVNYHCTSCTTVARAIQYNIGLDDPDAAPDRTRFLVARMKAAVAAAGRASSLTGAEAQIGAVIADFQDLAGAMTSQRDLATDDTTPGAGSAPASASPSPSTPATSLSPSPSTPTPTPSASPQPATTPEPSPSPT